MYRMKDFTLPLLLEYASKGEFHIADQTRLSIHWLWRWPRQIQAAK